MIDHVEIHHSVANYLSLLLSIDSNQYLSYDKYAKY